jgi:hypothetical protein
MTIPRAMGMIKYYSIHDIVKFAVIDRRGQLSQHLLTDIYVQYAPFQVKKLDVLDFTVYLVDSLTPTRRDYHVLDDNYHLARDYLFCVGDSHKLAKWRFEITGLGKADTSVFIQSNLVGSKFITGIIVDFLIHFALDQKGCSLIHASGLCNNELTYAFAGRGGTGKTTIALHLVERGFGFLGDNYLILQEGKTLGYPSPLNMFSYNLVPAVADRIRAAAKLALFTKRLLYTANKGYAKFFTKIAASDVFPNSLVSEAILDTIFVLVPGKKLCIESCSAQEIVPYLVVNQKLEFMYFTKYLTEFSYLFPESTLADHWHTYSANLKRNLSKPGIKAYWAEIPTDVDGVLVDDMLEIAQASN